MRPNPTSAAFREAAEPTLKRIRRDRRRVSERAAPLVAFIEERLFDVDLELRLGKHLKALPDEVVQDFCEALGVKPHKYASDRRLDVADRLLRATDWRIWKVANECGFHSAKMLSNRYKARTGTLPSQVRPAAVDAARQANDENSVKQEVRACVGALEPRAMVAFVQRVRSLGPSPPRREPSGPLVKLSKPEYRHERELAAAVWKRVGDLPVERLRRLLCHGARFRSPAMFWLLGEKGREIGRQDRKRGVALVELGVEVLEANADALGEGVHDLLTVGWSWIANQRRLQLDWPGCEEAFGFAKAEWETPRAARDPLAEAEYCNLLASFRFFQGRLEEASALANKAISLLRLPVTDRDLLLRALILRADIAVTAEKPEESITYSLEALGLIAEEDQPYLALALWNQLSVAYLSIGELENALGAISRAKFLNEALAIEIVQNQLLWVEGMISQARGDSKSAEKQLEGARAGFSCLSEMGHFAFATLALVEVLVERGRASEAMKMVIEIIPILESFKTHREILTAVRLLRAATAAKEINLELIRAVRDGLRSVRRVLLFHHRRTDEPGETPGS